MELTTIPLQNNYYYVYLIKTESKEILFINCDRLVNIVNFRQLLSNPAFNPSKIYITNIYTAHENYHDAMNAAGKLIRGLCGDKPPPFNTMQHYVRSANVICNESGVVYRNAGEACKSLGIDSPRMSLHLSKKPGHKSIRGLTFSYISQAPIMQSHA